MKSAILGFHWSASRPLAISERLLPDRAFPILQSRPQGSCKTVDVEIKRIVVTVGDLRIDRGMESRNEPSSGATAGNRVKERKPIILRSRKRGIGRARVVSPAAAWRAAARLDHFVVQ